MELPDIINTQYGFHCLIVGSVVFCAILVFVFGFKSAEEPPFDKLTYANDDRKPAGKKRKLKDKKTQQSNGQATAVGGGGEMKKSPVKERKVEALSEAKEANSGGKKKAEKAATNNRAKPKGKGKENVEVVKNKKNQHGDEKPKDFDDGEWEQALSRKDKMKRKAALEEIIPQKSEKKKEGKKKPKAEESDTADDSPKSDSEPIKTDDEKIVKEKSPVMEALAELGLKATEAEAKPKRTKKKKAAEGSGAETQEEAAPPPPQPPKQEKKQEPPPQPAPKPEPIEIPVVESNVAFDELGDTWKEAKAPKKAAKKKSRKD